MRFSNDFNFFFKLCCFKKELKGYLFRELNLENIKHFFHKVFV